MLTLALLIAFGSPFVAPILAATASAQASLPACCRLHGKHHCSMPEGGGQGSSNGAVLQGPPCPFCPGATQQTRTSGVSLTIAQRASVQSHQVFALLGLREGKARAVSAFAHLKRGPPCFFA
ncbi:MAG TPA: hypothetical protein VGU46_12155 [Acidobacteriaceae bacterium]|nr:hypothetical protein [Acidobacteriaceae bacterium]